MFRAPPSKDGKHLAFIRKCPCIHCGRNPAGTAAHVRYSDRGYGKRETGMREKPDDKWSVPLCQICHLDGPEAQHRSNERRWWQERNIDPLYAAQYLFECSGDLTTAQDFCYRVYGSSI